jgi:hypothetical protein
MAKFVVLAREAFTDMVRGLKSSAVKSTGKKTTDVSGMLRVFNERRGAIQRSYQKATGKELPANKVAVPKALYERLKSAKIIKKYDQNDLEWAMTEGSSQPRRGFGAPAERRRNAKRLEQPKRDQRKGGPLFPMEIGKRTYEEGQRMLTLKAEREAARSGRKINRTKYVTRRDLEEDTF